MVAEASHLRGFGYGTRVDRANGGGMETRAILNLTTAGSALFQEQVDRAIRRCTTRVNGAVATLAFRSGSGDAWHLTRQTPGTRAAWVNDDSPIDCDDDDCVNDGYAKTSFTYKFLEGCATISRHVIARGRTYVDILSVEMTSMVIGLMDVLEDSTFQGNFGGAVAEEFSGLIELLNGDVSQTILADSATIDAVPANSVNGDLTLKLLDQLLDSITRGPKAIFASKAGRRLIWALLQAQQEFVNVTRVRAGFEVDTYHDAPIVVTDGIPDDLAFGDVGGEAEITALTGATGDAASTAIFAVDLDEVFYGELTPLTVVPLAQCSSRKQRMDVYWDGVLVLACPESAAMIIGIDPEC